MWSCLLQLKMTLLWVSPQCDMVMLEIWFFFNRKRFVVSHFYVPFHISLQLPVGLVDLLTSVMHRVEG